MDSFLFKIEKDEVLIYRSIYAPVKSNMYAILLESEAIVIDPHIDNCLLPLLYENRINRLHILLTHEHYDHTNGVNWLKQNISSILYCQNDCARIIAESKNNNPALIALVLAEQDREDGGNRYLNFKREFVPYSCKVDIAFEKTTNWQIGQYCIEAIATPGHSPGSCCFKLNHKIVFTGDTLLQNIPVITRFKESNFMDYQSIALPFLQSLGKDCIIMPGHGNPFNLSETNNV